MITYSNVRFAYGANDEQVVLRGIDLTVEPGERVVVLGPNGSGKSTLARLANGLLVPDSGEVRVDGIVTTDESQLRELRTRVGFVAQDPESSIVATNVADEVAFGPENLGLPREEILERIDESLAAVGLSDKRDREPHTLSGGQKQRLAIAGVLAMAPQYIIFDEPTSMLDPKGVSEVRAVIDRLQSTGRGMLHITHDLTDLVGATRVVVIVKGTVVFEGDPFELLVRSELLEQAHLEVPRILTVAHTLADAGVKLPANPLDPVQLAQVICGDADAVSANAAGPAGEASCRS